MYHRDILSFCPLFYWFCCNCSVFCQFWHIMQFSVKWIQMCRLLSLIWTKWTKVWALDWANASEVIRIIQPTMANAFVMGFNERIEGTLSFQWAKHSDGSDCDLLLSMYTGVISTLIYWWLRFVWNLARFQRWKWQTKHWLFWRMKHV